jgi:hypothetical protein
MYKIFKSTKDTYITNKIISKQPSVNANIGQAGTLDLFKLYGQNFSGSFSLTELSRLLISFDTTKLKDLFANNKIDISDPTFKCEIKLFDVYGGQTTPSNFTVVANPLSRSFLEGLGRDVVYYSDIDICNFLTCSVSDEQWIEQGCASSGSNLELCDYYTTVNGELITSQQTFSTGEEDLVIDVTKAISASLKNDIVDNGFRLSFSDAIEKNNKSYFVKRFASRHAHDKSKHPQLILRFDDSNKNNTNLITTDKLSRLTLYNYVDSQFDNLMSASNVISGSDCLKLRLETQISGGYYSYIVSASQLTVNNSPVLGTYVSEFTLPSSDLVFSQKFAQSGSFKVKPIWMSVDGTIAYSTSSFIDVKSNAPSAIVNSPSNFIVTANIDSDVYTDEEKLVRINIFDSESPGIFLVRKPIKSRNLIIKKSYYSIKNAITNKVVIPFDETFNSTILSNDEEGMFFKLDCASLLEGCLYTIDVKIDVAGNTKVFENVSSKFKVLTRS